MPTRPHEFALVNDVIYPALAGGRRLHDFGGTAAHLAHAETAVFSALLSNLRPKCALEIGTQTGATLGLIARFAARVVSLDIDPAVKRALSGRWNHVELVTGDSHRVLPELLERLAREGAAPDFIFVDGDHTADGVRQDLNHILTQPPTAQRVVLMHDSFNPECRRGMLTAGWQGCRFCHFVDVDFCPGVLHPDPGVQREMWGGLGFALFLPTPRQESLEVKATHQILFEAAYRQSVYFERLKAQQAARAAGGRVPAAR